jgi:hypothetical protein
VGVVNYTSPHPNQTNLLKDSTCMVVYDGVVYLVGGRDFSHSALDFGLAMVDVAAKAWTTFALNGPLYSTACTVEYTREGATLWLAGGVTTSE